MEISLNYKANAVEFDLDRYSVSVFRGSQGVSFDIETSDEKNKKARLFCFSFRRGCEQTRTCSSPNVER